MKRVILAYLLIFTLMVGITPTRAADTSNIAVTADYVGNWAIFTVTLTHTLGATDDIRSQIIDLHGLELEGATMQAKSLVGATARDVNLDIEGSNFVADSTFEQYETRLEFDDFSAGTLGDELSVILDRDFPKTIAVANIANIFSAVNGAFQVTQVNTTGAVVTVLYSEKDRALRCRYIRVVSDGQTSNPVGSSTMILLRFKLTPGAYQPPNAASRVKSASS